MSFRLVRGLYKGASSSFIGMACESSLLFGIYSQTKQKFQGEIQNNRPQLQVIIPSAAFAGALISFILCPTELVKCRMQVQGKDAAMFVRYTGPLECALKTIQQEGVKGIFRGGLSTLLRESIGNATSPDPNYSRNPLQTLYTLHPRRRFTEFQFLQIYKRVGLSGCYAGIGPTLARAFPANAVAIVTWELTAKFLGIRRD
ncbi:hypothetical protein C4D60_Mb04t39780 [Musa balbisiana]|uniref:Uncharacterized protein n=1 Tax=Musa balbisiana TaxID=52838 RepID=A0A4S8KI24_MUSBA|nr:hypothetical protein C4D60_Mb04t39780 [Musa balbisiana]